MDRREGAAGVFIRTQAADMQLSCVCHEGSSQAVAEGSVGKEGCRLRPQLSAHGRTSAAAMVKVAAFQVEFKTMEAVGC